MHFHPRRTLVRALIVSLLVHAVLLIGVVRILPARIDAPTPAIRVVAMNRGVVSGNAPHPVPAAVEAPARIDTPVPSRAPKAVARKLALPDSRREDFTVPATPSAPAVADAAPPAQVAPRAGAGNSTGGLPQAAAPAASSGAASARRDGVGADDVRQYRFALGISARRFKRYPPLARERGWEGTAEVALDFRYPNAEPVLSLTSSRWKNVLHYQTLETLRQAVRRTDLPVGLRGRDFRMLQEITFSLEDEE